MILLKIKKLVRWLNNVFITLILLFFYFLIIGLGALIYRLFKKKQSNDSYWEDFPDKKFDLKYFKSPY